MNTNDKRAAALMLIASVIFGGLLVSRVSAQQVQCAEQDTSPLQWLCETSTVSVVTDQAQPIPVAVDEFVWGDDSYGLVELRVNPAIPFRALFVCNGKESGIFNIWVALYTPERLTAGIEYQQLFCPTERVDVWGSSIARFLCFGGSWAAGHRCRDLWHGYEVIIEQ